MKITKLQWTGIDVSADDYGAMRDFVKDVLGLHPVVDVPGFGVFATPNHAMVELYSPTAPRAPWRTGNAVGIGFDSDDLDAALAELVKHRIEVIKSYPGSEALPRMGISLKDGVHVVKGVGAGGGDYRYAFFRAPDGRVYAIAQSSPNP